ncbi:hypothetical protein R1sor_015576 [Riccia sorocarpa]|uniref:Uncharacterized protein n=1 Tax=Riccia sorocarpa TaxID=122646 RepID=A0ABD3HCM3_9MARC
MAASAVKEMRPDAVEEKQVVLKTSRQQSKKVVAGQLQKKNFEPAREDGCFQLEYHKSKEPLALEKTDGDMEGCIGRLALQASSGLGGIEDCVSGEGTVDVDYYAYEELQSNFCLRRYTEIVRQDRGDLKRSWPLEEKYLRGHVYHVWPPIGNPVDVSAVSKACNRGSGYPPGVPLPHLLELEIAFAESGLSEDREPSWTEAEDKNGDKWPGSHVTCSDFEVRRTFEGSKKMTKKSKFDRKVLARGADIVGKNRPRGKSKKQDRLLRNIEGNPERLEQVAVVQRGGPKTCSEAREKELHHGIKCNAKQAQGEDSSAEVKDLDNPRIERGKEKRSTDVNQDKEMVEKTSNAKSLVDDAEVITGRAVGVGKGKAAVLFTASEEEGEKPSSNCMLNVKEHENSNSRQGVREAEVTDRFGAVKETISMGKRRNESDRVVEERSMSKSDVPSASCFASKRQSNRACPVCRSFSSMSQTTMNVHIDSCLVEHQKAKEHEEANADLMEPETEPSAEPPPPAAAPPGNEVPKLSKGFGAKPKRKKRSIADIVASSVTRILEEEGSSPNRKKGVWLSSISYSTTEEQVQDSKNLNWVSGNKKKRQPRNLSPRNLKEEHDSKRRRISCEESAPEAVKPAKHEKRRLREEKESKGTTKKRKQLQVSSQSTNDLIASKVQEAGEVQCSRGRKTEVAGTAGQEPNIRSVPGKRHVNHADKGSLEREISGSVGLSQSEELQTSAQEALPLDLDKTLPQSVEAAPASSGRKSQAPAKQNSVHSKVKLRPGKGNEYSRSAASLDSPLLSADRLSPAGLFDCRTVAQAVSTEPAAVTLDITCGSRKSPGLSLTAEKLTSTSTTTGKSLSRRKSPRANTSVQRLKCSAAAVEGSPFSNHFTDDMKARRNTGDPNVGPHVELLGIAQCKMSKEVDSDLDQSETVADEAKLMQGWSTHPGRSRAVTADIIDGKVDHLREENVVKEMLGKSERHVHAGKRPTADMSLVSDDQTGSVGAEVDKNTQVGHACPINGIQDGCSTIASYDMNIVSSHRSNKSTRTPTVVISRMRKRGRLKAKLKNVSQKTKRKEKGLLAKGARQLEESSVRGSLSKSDLIQEASLENSQYREDIQKEEGQREERSRQAVDTGLELKVECNSGVIQPPVHETMVRRKEVVRGQEQVTESISLKSIGNEKKAFLLTPHFNNLETPVEHEENKEGQSSLTKAQASSTHTSRLQVGRESKDSLTSLCHATCRPLETEVISQAEEYAGAATPKVMVNNQSPKNWNLVPQRPVGRKKLPIRCPARSIGSSDAVASATSSLKYLSNKESLEIRGTEDPECSNGGDGDDISAATSPKLFVGRSRAARQSAKLEAGGNIGGVPGEVLSSEIQASTTVDALGEISAAASPEKFVSRIRAARHLAKSVPGGSKGVVHGEVSFSEGQTSITDNALAEPNTENSSNVGSTHAGCSLQAMVSQSSHSAEDLSRISTLPERVEAGTSSLNNGASELIDNGALLRSEAVAEDGVVPSIEIFHGAHDHHAAAEVHRKGTLFASSRGNLELIVRVPTAIGATADESKEKSPGTSGVPYRAEKEVDVREKHSDKLFGSGLTVSHEKETGVSSERSPDGTGLRPAPVVTSVQNLNDRESRESSRCSDPEPNLSEIFTPTFVDSQGLGRPLLSLEKAGEAAVQSRPDTQPPRQAFEPESATFTSGSADITVPFGAPTPKIASTSTQPASDNQNRSDLVGGSTRTPSYGLNCATSNAFSSQSYDVRPARASFPGSFTSLLQSAALPSQSSAALSLAMQGTRPLQEALDDRKELSRGEPRLSSREFLKTCIDQLTRVLGKPTSASRREISRVPAEPGFFRPRSEIGGSCKGSDSGEKEVSELPGWMRAAISDPKGSERGPLVATEAEGNLTEEVKRLAGSPEGEGMSGHVRMRLWGRDVVVPPSEKSAKGCSPTHKQVRGHRTVDPVGVVSGAGTHVAGSTRQINSAVMNTSSCENGITVSAGAIPALGKRDTHGAEDYLSRVSYNSHKSSCTTKNKVEVRKGKAKKGHASASQSGAPPAEIIIIDDSSESPADSGDSFCGGGLTMATLLDCGALRYLPVGPKGSPLMEVDPSKIPQRLVSQDFNILAELRKIGLVPAPKAALPACYRRTHSLSAQMPHSIPPSNLKARKDGLPPWLLAEKKRKEAQSAENVIVLDDDEEGPVETYITGERRPLNGAVSQLSRSNVSQQAAYHVSSVTTAEIERDPVNAKQISTIPASVFGTAPGSREEGSKLRIESVSPHGKEAELGESNIARRNHDAVRGMMSRAVYTKHVNSNTATDFSVMEESGLDTSATRKEQNVGLRAAPGPYPPLRIRDRAHFLRRTDVEEKAQGSDLQNEKRVVKAVTGVNKSAIPAAAVCGQDGSVLEKGSIPVFSILGPTWNGWPKRGAAAQACKQAVERFKAEILSSPEGGLNSLAGFGALRDLDSHSGGPAHEKSSCLRGSSSGSSESLSMCIEDSRGVSRSIFSSSRSGGDYEGVCGLKETYQSGGGTGQSSTPIPRSALIPILMDVPTMSKTLCVPDPAAHPTWGLHGEAQGTKDSEDCGGGLRPGTSRASDCTVINGNAKEPMRFDPSPILRSRIPVEARSENEGGTASLGTGEIQSNQTSVMPKQPRTLPEATGRVILTIDRLHWSDEVGVNISGTGNSGCRASDMPHGSLLEGRNWKDGGKPNQLSGSRTSDLSRTSIFGISSEAANSSGQGGHPPSHDAVTAYDERIWTLLSQTDTRVQASRPVDSSCSIGNGVMPDYGLTPLSGGEMVHAQHRRAANPLTAVGGGFIASAVGASKPKEPDTPRISGDLDCVSVSLKEGYSPSRSRAEEKMAQAQRGGPEFPSTHSGEKVNF